MKTSPSAVLLLVAAIMVAPALAEATTAISTLGSATATNSFDNGNFGQTWTWNTLTNGPGLFLESNGTNAPATGGGQILLEVYTQGANSASGVNTVGGEFISEHTGTSSTNYGVTGAAENGTHNYGVIGETASTNAGDAGVWGHATGPTGATYGVYGDNESATGYAGYFSNSAGGYAAAFMGGKVGVGTATPQSLVHAYGGEVQVGSSGASCATANNGAIRFSGSTLYYCAGTTWTTIGGGGSGTVTSSTAGQIAYYQSTGSTVVGTSMLNISGSNLGIGTATPQSLIQAYGGEVQVGNSGASCTTANNGAVRYSGGTLYLCTGTTWTAVGLASGMAGGFVNKIRNGNMLVSQRLATNTSTVLSTAADAYWIDGWYYHITGANVSGYWQNSAFTTTTGNNPASIPAYAEIKGAASNTAIDIYQRIENVDASPLAGETATVQFQFFNNSGASITPTFQTCYASAVNNFATCTADVSATSMQACANNTTCTEAYTFNVSSNAANGYQIQFNFGAMTSSSDIIEFAGFDLRTTPGAATGLNSAPPVIEEPNLSAELVRDQRYFQTSYGNGVPPGTATNYGSVSVIYSATTNSAVGWRFPVQFRAAPTMVGYAPDGTQGDWSYGGGTDTAVTLGYPSVTSIWFVQLTGNPNAFYYGHYTASSEL